MSTNGPRVDKDEIERWRTRCRHVGRGVKGIKDLLARTETALERELELLWLKVAAQALAWAVAWDGWGYDVSVRLPYVGVAVLDVEDERLVLHWHALSAQKAWEAVALLRPLRDVGQLLEVLEDGTLGRQTSIRELL